ncbi:hypothetical protein [Desulfopila inferna]|uniref:hypothetical protein n=1 Tax=Desulfopila inferna TaxID=468528 RepID=UPI001962A37F|nr:hypothetical protein [Desulfopila inferna]MBM9605521.1 hypothetical protein [Desulfopila inferna]
MKRRPSPEVLMAKAYDDLVDSRDTALSFEKEASMVADFTRLYIQNLFNLNESGLKSVMKKNRDLHAKAANWERRGRKPYELLQRQILKGDDLGKILKRYSAHLGALDCILDIRATAALVHHLIHLKPSDDLPAEVTGCEFGSGTGILSIAGSVPFVGSGRCLTMHAFEQSQESRDDSLKIIKILKMESRYKDQVIFHAHLGDVTTEKPYQLVRDAQENSGPLALWISETFGHRSKKPVVRENSIQCTFLDPSGVIPYSSDLEKKYDPLQQVLEHSCLYFDSFLQQIRQGSLVAFPDIVTPKVIIDGEKSSILSPDGIWRKLHEIGKPYDMLPPCLSTRWSLGQIRPSQKTDNHDAIVRKKKRRKYYCN